MGVSFAGHAGGVFDRELEASGSEAPSLEPSRKALGEERERRPGPAPDRRVDARVGSSNEPQESLSLETEERPSLRGSETGERIEGDDSAGAEPVELLGSELIQLLQRRSVEELLFATGHPEKDPSGPREARGESSGDSRGGDPDGAFEMELEGNRIPERSPKVQGRARLPGTPPGRFPREYRLVDRWLPEAGSMARQDRLEPLVQAKEASHGQGPAGLVESREDDVNENRGRRHIIRRPC